MDDHLHEDEGEDDDFSTEPGSVIKLEDGRGFVCKRQQPAILRYHRFNIKNKTEEEKHFYSKLLLYLPWRDEETELLSCSQAGKSYKDMYRENATTIGENESKFNKCGRSIDNALDMLVEGEIDERWNELYPAALQEAAECQQATSTVQTDIHETDVQANTNILVGDKLSSNTDACYNVHHQLDEMNDSDYDALLNSLNMEQANIVQNVKQWCQNTVDSVSTTQAKPPPFYSFVSGPGGVGKSHIIKAVYETCRKFLKPLHTEDPDLPTVLLTAPTGVAAYNIGGLTLHSAFQLNTQHSYQSLSSERQQTLHNTLRHLQLVISDEISMVGSQTLFDIHRRLKEIMNRSDYDDSVFGGVSVMAVGDLYQLQPVRQKYVFELPTEPYAKMCGCLWDKFVLYELTTSMRQSDRQFADMLNRVRTATPTEEDLAVLASRILPDDASHPEEALHVFATNAMTDQYNNTRLLSLPEPHYPLAAIDSKTDNNTGQVTVTMPTKSSETGGLKELLVLAVGARVMLTTNLDVADGLVNGARGEVVDFQFDKDGAVQTVFVKFDNPNVGTKTAAKRNSRHLTPIKKIEAKFSIGRRRAAEVTRCQFPLQLAWASSIHKVQGITTDNIVISFEGHFGPGQAYVALSRVKSLDGLHLKTFSSKKIICSNKVRQHMMEIRTRMTASNSDQSNELPVPANEVTSVRFNDNDYHDHSVHSQHTACQKNNPANLTDNVHSPNIFRTCSLTSMNEKQKEELCNLLELPYIPLTAALNSTTTSTETSLCDLILQHTAQQVTAQIHHTQGDGNCLFRSISLALANTEDHHEQLRHQITNHQLQYLDASQLSYHGILKMKESGEWGTDHEIIAAAHLFNCSVVCCSKYGSTDKLCLQHFSPHMLLGNDCTSSCKHNTVFLVNANGAHYDSVTVIKVPGITEE